MSCGGKISANHASIDSLESKGVLAYMNPFQAQAFCNRTFSLEQKHVQTASPFLLVPLYLVHGLQNMPTLLRRAETYKVCFWMRRFGAETMKRTMILTNHPALGRLRGKSGRALRRSTLKRTTKRYRDRQGRSRFCGTRMLKQSQNLSFD